MIILCFGPRCHIPTESFNYKYLRTYAILTCNPALPVTGRAKKPMRVNHLKCNTTEKNVFSGSGIN